LAVVRAEVGGVEPGLIGGADAGPVAIDDGVPRRVAVVAFDDDGLAEDAFVGEAEAFGGAARGRIERVALPFHSAIAEREGVGHEEEEGFRAHAGLLERGRISEVTEFDDAVRRVDAEVAEDTERAAGGAIENRVERGIAAAGSLGDPGGVLLLGLERPVREIRPHRTVAIFGVGGVERARVPGGVEWFDASVAPVDGRGVRKGRGLPVWYGVADGLAEGVNDWR
jgi:hypothetical protein